VRAYAFAADEVPCRWRLRLPECRETDNQPIIPNKKGLKCWPLLPTQHEVDTEALQAKNSGRSSFLSELYVRRGLWNLQLDLTPGPSDDPFDPP
jgi:hypothetical protein